MNITDYEQQPKAILSEVIEYMKAHYLLEG
jgi:hypothetical protein